MRIHFVEAAREELAHTIRYYNDQKQGLGEEFQAEFWSMIESINEHPLAWRRLSTNTRRCRLHRFPYGIVYRVRDEEILIVAVTHLHRKQNYWRHR